MAKKLLIFVQSKNDIKRIRERYWKKHLKAVGLDYRPIYHTRHSFTTLMLSNNEDSLGIKYVRT